MVVHPFKCASTSIVDGRFFQQWSKEFASLIPEVAVVVVIVVVYPSIDPSQVRHGGRSTNVRIRIIPSRPQGNTDGLVGVCVRKSKRSHTLNPFLRVILK